MGSVIKLITAMCIWGSLGIFVKNISLESVEIAFLRAIIASIMIGIICYIKSCKDRKINKLKHKLENEIDINENINKESTQNEHNVFNKISNKKSLITLILSGILIGFNWVFLFKSYEYTTVSNSTLSYYFAPIIVILISPIILKEKLTLKSILSVLAAMFGLILILNSQQNSQTEGFNHIKGIAYGLMGAFSYACAIIINKYIKESDDYKRTFIQLFTAGMVLLPFIIYRDKLILVDIKSLINILILGSVHTCIAYTLYFSSIKDLSTQTIALLSYVDPVSSIIFSALFLKEPLFILQIIGGIIILSSTFIGQMKSKENKYIKVES